MSAMPYIIYSIVLAIVGFGFTFMMLVGLIPSIGGILLERQIDFINAQDWYYPGGGCADVFSGTPYDKCNGQPNYVTFEQLTAPHISGSHFSWCASWELGNWHNSMQYYWHVNSITYMPNFCMYAELALMLSFVPAVIAAFCISIILHKVFVGGAKSI